MKKIIIIFVFVAPVFLFGTMAYADTSVNLIQNPSLETASQTSPNTPDLWYSDSFGNNSPAFTYPVPGHLGGSAAKIDMAGRVSGDAKWFFEPVPVTPGTQYAFSDYYMSTVRTRVTVQYTMLNGSFQYQDIGFATPSPHSWQQFTSTFIVPANVAKVSVFHRILKNGSLTVDDYSLTDPNLLPTPPPLPPPPPVVTSSNLILNSSVELQTNNLPDNWFTDIEGNTAASFAVVPGHNGGSAVQTAITSSDPNGGDAKWIWTPVAVDPNGDYTFSEYYMSDSKNVVIVEFNMADGTRQFTNLVVLPPAADWTQVTKEFNVRPGAVSVTVFDVLRQTGTLVIDDVSLSKLPDGTFGEGLVTLSFDDGGSSFYQNALPPLTSHNFTANVNVVNDFINQPGYMTTSQITEINKDEMAVDSHSSSHPYLTSLSDSEIQQEAAGSRSTDLSLGFAPVSVFVYPYGDWDQRTEDAVKSAGYSSARITDQGFNTKNSNPYELRTWNVENTTTLAEIKQWIDDAIANKTWLILGMHDVGFNPANDPNDTYTITPAAYQQIIDYLAQTGVKVVSTEGGLNLMH